MAQFNIDLAEIQDLENSRELIMARGQKYTALEQHVIYDLYNRIYGTEKQPNGCPSCLSATIAGLRKALRIIDLPEKK
jgi:hypothetical protein